MRREHVLWTIAACGLAAFVALALGYEHDPLETIDRETSSWVARELPDVVEWSARPFSWLGGWIGLTALAITTGFLLVRNRLWVDLAFLLAAFLGGQAVVAVLKELIGRLRPDVGSAVPLPSSLAFPSGHAAAGAASLGAVAVLVAERLPTRRARAWLWSCTIVLGVGVGLSRVALNVHYVTDVVAGWCLGLAWLAACLLARDHLRARQAG
ncbi:MAG TPA: phosphatase PAP2 family protein [Gaiellaceae bacterium]|nr:phosphatase PAP2 family protein [Gaiellaceae bacterium]